MFDNSHQVTNFPVKKAPQIFTELDAHQIGRLQENSSPENSSLENSSPRKIRPRKIRPLGKFVPKENSGNFGVVLKMHLTDPTNKFFHQYVPMWALHSY